ncbi:histone acetyltransferase subunit NuA4-domain-containing protein [Cercophora scortea]|uniref:Chromatin modification-related protein EAF6 n=1 Tax=Cercophora scortea TaxID=314031 RepID=A0AAE0J722_9PEZI|nr:histone acetyltransferase subunit NuA4-domain-containing protein [Cercophora scortea]
MGDSGPSKSGGQDGPTGIPYYEKQRHHLKDLIARRRALEKRIAAQEESIYAKETEYLENTPSGNIITGFDNYTKGTANAAAQRRKTGLSDANRVFSRSSVSYNPSAEAQTPASTPAPTPVSTSFKDKETASGAPTPTSATAGKATSKKSKKASSSSSSAAAAAAAAAAATAAAGGEDSETDSKETVKKIRANFGAVRK